MRPAWCYSSSVVTIGWWQRTEGKNMIQKNWQELIKPNKVEFTSSGRTKATL
ncbi:DNA-directed RNA polymerase subunit alpha, partial [Rhizobium sp. NPDC092017]